MDKIYDVVILGGGPASMSAGVYCKQMGLNTLLIEKSVFGGQISTTSSVSNYLGFKEISGEKLSQLMHEHVGSVGIDIRHEEITNCELNDEIKVIKTHGNEYLAKAVIIGIGTSPRSLGVDNDKMFINRGISYSALKDGQKYTDKVVAVVGGGNSAIEDALLLSKTCKKVYLVHRRQEFRGDADNVCKLYNQVNAGKIELVLDSRPHSIEGIDSLSALNVFHIPTEEIKKLEVDCVFVAIGRGADTDIIDRSINRNEMGYIITDEHMKTNISGVYAIGDIRNTPYRQIVTAVSDGAIASLSAFNYIKELRTKK